LQKNYYHPRPCDDVAEWVPGPDTVPQFLKFYSGGLPSKLQADPRARLVTLLYSGRDAVVVGGGGRMRQVVRGDGRGLVRTMVDPTSPHSIHPKRTNQQL